ncbi:hypothetical protein MLD38_001806 [Melastoma candidum]|uniref:Uncharacterized protein n=1 Tax=Melastoma candidum TaxID=119954 RepID=A0ACB9SDQ8_9MYRT|nr:hypothetical protein MLD38_001806 [Melastoma candidum]
MDCRVSSSALPRKLTGSTSVYDGVFSGYARGSSGVEDYDEVFGRGENARPSEIPVLDIPCFREARVRVDVRASALDYSAVFGGGAGGFAAASSFEEVVGCGGKEGRRVKARKRSPSQLSNNGLEENRSVHESSTLSSNEAKRFNVSYSKSNIGSNGEPNGAVYVAQLADIAGYSVLVEESGCLNQAKVDINPVGGVDGGTGTGGGMVEDIGSKSVPSSVPSENSSQKLASKVTSNHRSSKGGSFSGELLFDRCGFMVGKDLYGQDLPSNLFSASPEKKAETNGRLSPRSVSEGVDNADWLPDLVSELDANSAAAATAVAVKIAIEEAQARIKAAKEIMGGKKVFEFKVRVKKKIDREHMKGNTKANKEELYSRVLHQKAHEEGTRVHSLGGIPKPNLSKVHAVTAEVIDMVKSPTLRQSLLVGPEGKHCETGLDCGKGEFKNREPEEEEDLFEDARAESDHPVRDGRREVIGVKKENLPSDVEESNCNQSASRNSVVVVNAERALDEALCQEKATPGLLIAGEAKKSEEQMAVPFELVEKMTAKKEGVPYMVSDEYRKFAFHFLMTPFEKLPEFRIPRPEVNLETPLPVGKILENCAADVSGDHGEDKENGDDFSDEHDGEMGGDLGMATGNGEVGEEQEQCCDTVNGGIQFEELCNGEGNSLEYSTESLVVEPETAVSEVYDPVISTERNDSSAGFQGERESNESPDAGSIEMMIPDGNHTEDLKIHPVICDAIKAEKVPAEVKPTRRCWTVETHDVRQLINAVAANAREPNVHEQLVWTQRDDGQNQHCTANEVMDDVEKEDSENAMLKNASVSLEDAECGPTEVLSDSNAEEKYLDEPVDLIGDDFRHEEMNLEDYATEAFDSLGATSNLDDASVNSDLTYDEVSERSSTDGGTGHRDFCNSEDKLNESEVSQFSGPESEVSVEEAKSETEADISVDDFICAVIAGTLQLDDGFAKEGEAQTTDMSAHADKNGENHKANLISEVKSKENLQCEKQVEEARIKNDDKNKEMERAREKERKAVERAINEARERAYIEARERAERAAVEKATAEARQRGIAQTREKLGNSSSERSKRADDKKLVKAKLKAERAAVERATAEARERALEKALAVKLAAGDKDYKSGKKSNEPQHGSVGSSSNWRRPSASDPSTHCAEKSEGDGGESAQRRKARLERHQRTAERAAKALAEKNKRDLLAQREQAERNRLAETLEADIKRWSSGKQGNLRALLSTLQYILGPNSGWQPVTLTEIVTAAAVRKAYRKATLYVHPDKLQQRGASLQQKYICEKVFDLLKDAWNKFSAEER